MARATGATEPILSAGAPYSFIRSLTVTESQGVVDVTGSDSTSGAVYIAGGVKRFTANVTCWYDTTAAPPATGASASGFDFDARGALDEQPGLEWDGDAVVSEVSVVIPLEDGIEVNYSMVGNGAITIA